MFLRSLTLLAGVPLLLAVSSKTDAVEQTVTGDPNETPVLLDLPWEGKVKWEFRHYIPRWAGTLSTAGNRLVTSPVTFSVDGRQYVTMPSGSALLTFALPQ
jgi:hypothetical protein